MIQPSITLSRDSHGELSLHCSHCDTVTTIGHSLCCQWAKRMYWKYCYGKLRYVCVTP